MKYKISNAYIKINGEDIPADVVLEEDDKPTEPYTTEINPLSEYEKGLKEFKYGRQKIDDLAHHCVVKFVDFKAVIYISEKWIKELELMGYDISKLININKGD